MYDIRVVGICLDIVAYFIGVFVADHFHFSEAWIQWPCGIFAVLLFLFAAILEAT